MISPRTSTFRPDQFPGLRTFVWGAVLTVGSSAIAAQVEGADGPRDLPSGPDAPVVRDFQEDRRAMWREALVADLRSRVEQPSRHAIELLELYPGTSGGWWTSPDRAGILRLARPVLLTGDVDPLVRLVIADAAFMEGDQATATAMMPKAVEDLLAAPCSSSFLVAVALSRLSTLHRYYTGPEEAESTNARAIVALADAAGDPIFDGARQRHYCSYTIDTITRSGLTEEFVERMRRAAGPHRYLSALMRSHYHTEKAFAARGGGWAASVTERSWELFRQHMEKAGEFAAEAISDRSDLPGAATQMIRVLGPSGGRVDELRSWFDRAVAAEFDHGEAYGAMANYLMPRWGGSIGALLGLAEEAVETERYDTSVPRYFFTFLERVLWDVSPEQVLAHPRIRARIEEVRDGYRKQPSDVAFAAYRESLYAMVLALSGRVEEAALVRRSLGERFDQGVIAEFGQGPDWLDTILEDVRVAVVPPWIPLLDEFDGWRSVAESMPSLPIGEVADTEAEASERLQEWLDETARTGFEQHGEVDPAVREDALALASALGSSWSMPRDGAFVAYVNAARRVLRAGSADPLLALCAAQAFERLELEGEAERAFEQAVTGFDLPGSSYPSLFRFLAIRSFDGFLRQHGRGDEAAALRSRLESAAAESATDPRFAGENAVWFVELVIQPLDYGFSSGLLSPDVSRAIAEQDGVDPWLRAALVGIVATAWVSNNKPSVGDAAALAAWGEVARSARTMLERAHELRPEWPHAAATMIALQLACPGEASRREWLDRAVRARADHFVAYRNYAWSLRPERAGSLPELLAFARACADVDEVDLRAAVLVALEYASATAEINRSVWRDPDVLSVVETLEARDREADVRAGYWRGLRGAIAWARGDYDTAIERLDGITAAEPFARLVGSDPGTIARELGAHRARRTTERSGR